MVGVFARPMGNAANLHYPQSPDGDSSGRSIVAAGTAVPAARFTPRLRVANAFGIVPTGHALPSVSTGHLLPSGALHKHKAPFPFPAATALPSGPATQPQRGEDGPKRAARWGQGAPHQKGRSFCCPATARTTCPRQVGRAWARTGPSERRGEGKGPFPFKPRQLLSSY